MSIQASQLPFPAKIVRRAGALDSLGAFCRTRGNRIFILGGETALQKTKEKICTNLAQAGLQVTATAWYGGECSRKNIRRLAEGVAEHQADMILAVGGGKALDTGKAVSAECRVPVVTVPTIAATCAAVTPLTVLYDDNGEFAGNLFLTDCPAGTIIDTEVIVGAPGSWLAAGMGDTLAKMYELRAAAARMTPTSITMSAVSQGQICYDIIKRFGSEALEAVANKRVTEALDSTVDAIIVVAGLSSIFGGEKLRNAAAHAIYNGLTKIAASHAVPHGLIVGYGNLCLLALEERQDDEIIGEIKLAARCGIPTMLSQIVELSETELHIMARAASTATAMSCMPFEVSEDMVIDAIRRVDSLAVRCFNATGKRL